MRPDEVASTVAPGLASTIAQSGDTNASAASPPQRRSVESMFHIDQRVGDRYVISATLGRGGMGVVYRARDEKLGEEVALKVVRGRMVNATVPPTRVAGMHLVNNYAEAAAIAFGQELLSEAEAREVMNAARTEGLAITAGEIDALLDAHR